MGKTYLPEKIAQCCHFLSRTGDLPACKRFPLSGRSAPGISLLRFRYKFVMNILNKKLYRYLMIYILIRYEDASSIDPARAARL
jgi:hypothetical protein